MPMKNTMTMNRLRSESSMSRLIMHRHSCRLRAEGADLLCRRVMRRQTHHDCLDLDQENGEQEVLRDGRRRDWNDRAPRVAEDESGYADRENDPCAEHRARDERRDVRSGLSRVVSFRGRATAVRLGLGDHALRDAAVVGRVHRECASLRTAGHTGLRRRGPSRAHGHIAGHQGEGEDERW